MSTEHLHDVAIAGLGAMGSAAAYQLAKRGLEVIGFDRHTPPHPWGSSHGDSRIIREAYFEHPVYVPMVQRAYELWHELEALSGHTLLHSTGGLMIGRPDSVLVQGARHSAETHGLPHQVLSASELSERFPLLQPEPDMVAVWEPRAGVLSPEVAVSAMASQARRQGARLHLGEAVERWRAHADGIHIETAAGSYRARQLIISAGAWAASLLQAQAVPLQVERQVLHWFEPSASPEAFTPARCPVHLWQFDGHRFFYSIPNMGAGVKLAFHHGGALSPVDQVRRDIDAAEIDDIQAAIRRFVPTADGRYLNSAVCLYTNTPDEHFWIDRCPGQPAVWLASPCSGHGFKFAPVIGEVLADLVQGRPPAFDLGLFRWR
ncbi:N-methyl-L-tryptophan oxidase [Ideonella sp. DXS29W]|uniref:N-methyl-L-tryptophan oxidase n=1 Tax=Ideonella lacteola TaxID=2984193 RepID=A0ABU9BYJ0_9BURK